MVIAFVIERSCWAWCGGGRELERHRGAAGDVGHRLGKLAGLVDWIDNGDAVMDAAVSREGDLGVVV